MLEILVKIKTQCRVAVIDLVLELLEGYSRQRPYGYSFSVYLQESLSLALGGPGLLSNRGTAHLLEVMESFRKDQHCPGSDVEFFTLACTLACNKHGQLSNGAVDLLRWETQRSIGWAGSNYAELGYMRDLSALLSKVERVPGLAEIVAETYADVLCKWYDDVEPRVRRRHREDLERWNSRSRWDRGSKPVPVSPDPPRWATHIFPKLPERIRRLLLQLLSTRPALSSLISPYSK